MNPQARRNLGIHQIFIYLGLVVTFGFLCTVSGSAQADPAFLRFVQVLEQEKTGLSNPAGLAYSTKANSFFVIEANKPGQSNSSVTEIARLNTFGRKSGSDRILATIQDPINIAYDPKLNRVLFLQTPSNQLFEVREDTLGDLDSSTMAHFDVRYLGLRSPEGMTVDPVSGDLYILDQVGPRIIRIQPGPGGRFDQDGVYEIRLEAIGLTAIRGFAFDPGSGHLHILSTIDQKLYELTPQGQLIAYRDLSVFHLTNPQGLVFAPSGDQTDDASEMSLFLADCGSGSLLGETGFSNDNSVDAVQDGSGISSPEEGRLLELSFEQTIAPLASTFQTSLVRTVDLANIIPPSPDPSGITYQSVTNTLVISDGEVEETVNNITHFQGANVWEVTLNGNVVRTANISQIVPTVVPMSDEPNGVAWNPTNGHYYFSDDNALKVFDLNPGHDGWIGTSDDSWTSFSTQSAGSADPEGIAYDSWQNTIFVVDGTNQEIYRYSVYGDLLSHFDVERYGVIDPESVEFNPISGTLFVLSNSGNKIIIELLTDGTLLGTYDASTANVSAPAGIAYAPASDGSGEYRFYVVGRGLDNNYDPTLIDGKLYEITAPQSTPSLTVTPTSNVTPTITITPTMTFTPSPTVTPDHSGFPMSGVLDDFDRADGLIGPDWSFRTTGYSILNNQLTVGAGGPILWNPSSYGANQEAYVTISQTDPAATEIDVLLKSQVATTITSGVLDVWYNPSKNRIRVSTYDPVQKWVIWGADIRVTFVSGDQLGAVATEDGKVYVYRNGILLGIRDVTGWPYYSNSGYVGLYVIGPSNVALNDFGGGTIPENETPAPTATSSESPSSTPTLTPLPMVTPTSTPTSTPLPTATPTHTSTSTPLSTATSTPLPTATSTFTPTFTQLPTATPTFTPTFTPTSTQIPTITPTFTPSPTATATQTSTATPTPTLTSTVTPTQIPSPTNTPLPDLIFMDGFESGDLSAWSGYQSEVGLLTVNKTAAMEGNYGLQVQILSNNSIYVMDNLPEAEPTYRVHFLFNPNSIGMGKNDTLAILVGYTEDGTAAFLVELRNSKGNYQLRAGLISDRANYTYTQWINITDNWHSIEINWQAATALAANDGSLDLWIDDVREENIGSIDNDIRRIDSIRLGAIDEIDNGTRGIFFFDSFESHRKTQAISFLTFFKANFLK